MVLFIVGIISYLILELLGCKSSIDYINCSVCQKSTPSFMLSNS